MHVVHDWEFVDDGQTINPISAGFVREDGPKLYIIFNNADAINRAVQHPWLRDNVIPHLPIRARHTNIGDWMWDKSHPDHQHVMPLKVGALKIKEFIQETPDPWLWAWYGAYDHVAMAHQWGKMIQLPKGVPMQTDDIKTLEKMAAYASKMGRISLPTQTNEHRAIDDALWGMQALKALSRMTLRVPRVASPHTSPS